MRDDTQEAAAPVPTMEQNPDIYINPVCGVPVQKSTAKIYWNMKGTMATSAVTAVSLFRE